MSSLSDIEQKALAKLSYGERIRPIRDWLTLLSFAAVLFIVSAAWNIWFYYNLVQSPESGTSTSLPTLNTDAITKAEQVFGARADEQSRYENIYSFVDPSK